MKFVITCLLLSTAFSNTAMATEKKQSEATQSVSVPEPRKEVSVSEPAIDDAESDESATTLPEEAESETMPEQKHSQRDSYSALVVSYVLSPKISFKGEFRDTTAFESGSLTYLLENAFKIGYEWSQFRRNSWNNGFFFDYIDLKFDSFKLKGDTSGEYYSEMTGGMTILTGAYSGKYRWDTFYLPVAAGFSSSTVDSSGSLTKSIRTRALVSAGVGFAVHENFSLEFMTSAVSVIADSVTSGTVTIRPTELGYLTYSQISLKALF